MYSQETATQSHGNLSVSALSLKDLSWLIIDQRELQHLPQPVINPRDKITTLIYSTKVFKELWKGFFKGNCKGAKILLVWPILKKLLQINFS